MIKNISSQEKSYNGPVERKIKTEIKMQDFGQQGKKPLKTQRSTHRDITRGENQNYYSEKSKNEVNSKIFPKSQLQPKTIKLQQKMPIKLTVRYDESFGCFHFKKIEKEGKQLIKDSPISSYQQVLRKHRQLGGKPKSKSKPHVSETSKVIYSKTPLIFVNDLQKTGREKLSKLKQEINQLHQMELQKPIYAKSGYFKGVESQTTANTDLNQKKNIPLRKSKTKIRLIGEKNHDPEEIITQSKERNIKLLQAQLQSTSLKPPNQGYIRKSSSVPNILTNYLSSKPLDFVNKPKENKFRNSSVNKNKVLQTEEFIRHKNQLRQQNSQQLTHIKYSLSNLKQRISQIKHQGQSSRTRSRLTTNDMETNTLTKTKNIFEICDLPVYLNGYKKIGEIGESRTIKKDQSKNVDDTLLSFNEQIQKIQSSSVVFENQHEISHEEIKNIMENISQIQVKPIKNQDINGLMRLRKEKEHFQFILEGISNENKQKQQELMKLRGQNKNMDINLLAKKQKIIKLNTEINNNKVIPWIVTQNVEKEYKNREFYVEIWQEQEIMALKHEKKQKQVKYKLQRERLKQELEKMQVKMREQQKMFQKLKKQENEMENSDFLKEQEQNLENNKLLMNELAKKIQQLEITIKKQQQKTKQYQQQIKKQRMKSQQTGSQLKELQKLQEVLVEKLQKLRKQRQNRKEEGYGQRNEERLKILIEIKQVQENENKIILQYQRDIQAISTMMEAMRVKNIELENKIKQNQNRQKTTSN